MMCLVTECPNEGIIRIRATIGGWNRERTTFIVPVSVTGFLCAEHGALAKDGRSMLGIDFAEGIADLTPPPTGLPSKE